MKKLIVPAIVVASLVLLVNQTCCETYTEAKDITAVIVTHSSSALKTTTTLKDTHGHIYTVYGSYGERGDEVNVRCTATYRTKDDYFFSARLRVR